MSVFNGQKYLCDAIDSIRSQTFTDYEFIIIDDGSTDCSGEIIKKYSEEDDRIRYIRNDKNIGLTRSLNKALSLAKGKYIARMDADDIAFPDRIEKQVQFMDTHTDVVLSGCGMKCFGKRNDVFIPKTDDMENRAFIILHPVVAHPTFIFKREVFTEYHIRYNEKLRYAQDYFFAYQVQKAGKVTNLDDILLYYRYHRDQISTSRLDEQNKCAFYTRKKILADMGIHMSSFMSTQWKRYTDNGTVHRSLLTFICGALVILRILIVNRFTGKISARMLCRVLKEDFNAKYNNRS